MRNIGQRLLRIAFLSISLAPWLTTLAVYILAFSVRLSYGKWPVVYQDSPNLPPLIETALPYAMLPSLAGIIFFPIVWIILFVVSKLSDRKTKLLLPTIVFALGMILQFFLSRLDPWGFQTWFFD